MCRIDYADEATGFWRTELHEVAGRKDHRCDDCGRTIPKGERHTYGVWLDTFEFPGHTSVRMCPQCVAAGRWLTVVCGGHFWPGVLEELREHWDEEFDLRSHGLGRLVKVGEDRWLRRGRLVDVATVEAWVERALARVPSVAKREVA